MSGCIGYLYTAGMWPAGLVQREWSQGHSLGQTHACMNVPGLSSVSRVRRQWPEDRFTSPRLHTLKNQIALLFCHTGLAYMGKTRKPENVEYFHPPIRFPRSSLRYALSPFSMAISTPLLAASRVTSWSPAKAEITGQPLCIKLTCSTDTQTAREGHSDPAEYLLPTSMYDSVCVCVYLRSIHCQKINVQPWCSFVPQATNNINVQKCFTESMSVPYIRLKDTLTYSWGKIVWPLRVQPQWHVIGTNWYFFWQCAVCGYVYIPVRCTYVHTGCIYPYVRVFICCIYPCKMSVCVCMPWNVFAFHPKFMSTLSPVPLGQLPSSLQPSTETRAHVLIS